MSLPVSQYEALLAEVRGLRRKAQRVQQLATPLISNYSSFDQKVPTSRFQDDEVISSSSFYKMDPLLTGRRHNVSSHNCDVAASSSADTDTTCSEDEYIGGGARGSAHLSVSSEPTVHRDRSALSMLYHGTWPVERTMWNSEPTPNNRPTPALIHHNHLMQDVTSVMSFASSSGGVPLDRVLASPNLSRRSSQQQLEAKVDMVYSLLAMLSGQEHADMGETLLALSTNPESCLAMRQSGCIPLLVQILQSDREPDARKKASQALHNLVHSQPDEKMRKREVRVFKLLEHTRAYTEALRQGKEFEMEIMSSTSEDDDRHPVQTVAHLMKLSFDELHRQAICTLGGIHTIANLVEAEHVNHGSTADEAHCILMRRYACMALTNLTFGDSGNKALLCSFREFMRALVVQLQSPSDELRQVTASVLRNLSWRADSTSKEILREVGSVTGLMKAAMMDNKENTLKSILSALWNLSAHCTENKSEICSVEGALGFLVDMLTYKTPSKSLAIIENSGGILRNISSQIAVRDDYREILRQHNCLQVLLDQLKSPSLTIVSNACGTLWNLSAKCPVDQEALWQMGAPSMLRSLNHSKHKMIAMGSSAALKNLLSARPSQTVLPAMDSTALAMDLPALPTLGARKQKALLQDLDQTLSETYENIEKDSPVKVQKDLVSSQDYLQKNGKNKFKSSSESNGGGGSSPVLYEADFTGLNFSLEPPSSSSYESKLNLSLETSQKKCFLKTVKTKSDTDSGLQSLERGGETEETISSLNSIDNDKYRKCETKLKEISACSDEKDHCSIEDVSDSDNQSSIGCFDQRSGDESGFLTARREVAHSSTLSTPSLPPPLSKYGSLATSNITMFEGDIDEIEMEDISIHFTPEHERKTDLEENTEKQDTENEKNYTDFIGIRGGDGTATKAPSRPLGSGIPLPRSFPRPIPTSINNCQLSDCVDGGGFDSSSSDVAMSNNSETSAVKKTMKSNSQQQRSRTSNLPRRGITQTSTPIPIRSIISSSTVRGEQREALKERESIESGSLQNDETVSLPEYSFKGKEEEEEVEDSSRSIQQIDCSLPILSPISDLNISQEQNNSIEEPIKTSPDRLSTPPPMENLEMESKPIETKQTEDDCFTTYLNPENCVNFSLKDDDRDRLLERSCEESNLVDNRMLDPDAMIESLDRFTAELVSQASHLQQSKADEDKYKDNTWNEDTSPNELTFPSLSSNAPNVITFSSSNDIEIVPVDEQIEVVEQQSNDFSSINTNTMTQSTLIAIEATKMASVFKNEAEMSQSMSSIASLELDKVQPPSLLDSLNNSAPTSADCCGKSPKLTNRKKSLPKCLMVKKALTNSLNHGSSLESLENHSLSYLDQMNPPSAMGELLDMEGSITSVASLPSEHLEMKTDFLINGAVTKNNSLLLNNNGNMMNVLLNSRLQSVSDLENINPPSFFNEITDLCNSLADVPTEAIGSETEIFEDCNTHVEDEVTEFSDANSATPIQSDLASSSPEVSPKKAKVKQRRIAAKDRYRTYTVAPETLPKDAMESTSDDFKSVSENYRSVLEDPDERTLYDSPTYSVKSCSKLTPKEKRQQDRSRFETQVVEEAVTDILQQPVIGGGGEPAPTPPPPASPSRTKLSIRRNFMQKRLENKDRFKTQTLSESSFSPEISSSPNEMDIHLLVQKEANLVLKSLRETKTSTEELLDCETLSLVSNDDDSEHNSGSPINYRTYHKSWGMKKNVPVIEPCPKPEVEVMQTPEPDVVVQTPEPEDQEQDAEEEEEKQIGKPKIVKPPEVEEEVVEEEPPQGKGIRGRRKPLYSKTPMGGNKVAPKSLKPIKNMTSNLVKNVASSIKSVKATKTTPPATNKPPVAQSKTGKSGSSPKTSPARTTPKPKPLERQGTFTKDDSTSTPPPPPLSAPKSRIPTPGSATRIPPPKQTKIPNKPGIPRSVNSASSDRSKVAVAAATPPPRTTYGRSTSADSREAAARRIQNSVSSQSLKNERQSWGGRKSSIPHPTPPKTGSNSSLNSNNSAKKQVTSKIASLWKKIEESKNKQPVKKDTRVWIQPAQGGGGSETTGLVRSNTFDNKDGVTLRNKGAGGGNSQPEKRVSRLGSFIVMDETEDGARLQEIINAAAATE